MNSTKRNLIIVVIVLNFLSIALNTYLMSNGILAIIKDPYNAYLWFYTIYEGLGVLAYIATAGLLIYSIKDGGRFFRTRSGYYMTAVVITFILNIFSVSSILLGITLFMNDIVWVKPTDDVYFEKEKPSQENSSYSQREKERKIEALRKLKEEGKITEAEFNEALFKLL